MKKTSIWFWKIFGERKNGAEKDKIDISCTGAAFQKLETKSVGMRIEAKKLSQETGKLGNKVCGSGNRSYL